ncbi:MAG: hypothetical protein JWM20_395 [Patescibacteria group bacterium]|nr:hypothetical protein [Patescibacteria group bacterium]
MKPKNIAFLIAIITIMIFLFKVPVGNVLLVATIAFVVVAALNWNSSDKVVSISILMMGLAVGCLLRTFLDYARAFDNIGIQLASYDFIKELISLVVCFVVFYFSHKKDVEAAKQNEAKLQNK